MITDRSRPNGDEIEKQQPQNRRPRTTIRVQLLIVVNAVLAVFVAFFLVFDYRRDVAGRLEDKRIALEEEATTLLPAVLQMKHHARDSVQQYIDTVCGRMQETHSPGHHIAVKFENDTFQALAHHRASPEMLRAMQQAADSPRHRSRFGGSEIVVGAHERSGATVYVSETMENLYGSVISDVVRRLTGFIVLALVAGVVVNLALSHIVTRPLRQLVDTVRKIGQGQLGVQSDSFHSAELNYLTPYGQNTEPNSKVPRGLELPHAVRHPFRPNSHLAFFAQTTQMDGALLNRS